MDIFTTGFPRSGSTWLNRILSHLFNARMQTMPGEKTVTKFAERIDPDYVIRKTHWYRHQYPGIGYDGEPCKIVWISRDPRDMAVSIMYYRSLPPSKLRDTIVSLDNPKSDGVGIHDYADGWLKDPPDYHVTYEDLHFRPRKAMAEMWGSITDEPLPGARMMRVVPRQKFNTWKEDYPHSMRKGIVGDWKNHFKYDDAVLFEKLYGDLLRVLGYETDPNWIDGVPD